MQAEQTVNEWNENEGGGLDIGLLLYRLLKYWYWLVLGLLLGYAIAHVYLRYTIPTYEAHTTLLIKNDKSRGLISEEDLIAELGMGGSGNNISNFNYVGIYGCNVLAVRDEAFHANNFLISNMLPFPSVIRELYFEVGTCALNIG